MTATAPAPLTIRIGEEAGIEVAPDLWGLFLEDINNAIDGGLNAQLIRNGDFEFTVHDHPDWGPLTGWRITGDGEVSVRGEDPVHHNNATYIRATGPVTLTNEGWDGVAVTAGDTLRFQAVSWRVFGEGDIVAAVTGDGHVLAVADASVPAGGWQPLQADLIAASTGRGEFSLSIPAGLTVELDTISLRPLGADGQPLLFRPDLVAVLAQMSPSFVRFPGGCVAHGLGLANMYTWKPTVGPVAERVQLPNLWGYHQSRQIGYFEYFLLCEMLGATALPVLAAGVCCQNTRGGPKAIPLPEMPAYTQDVLDLIEFANGPVTSTWGAVRAGMGHPEPFALRYLGIGNEDSITDDFRVRYAQIEDAVRSHHPEITVVGTVGPAPHGTDWEAGWQFAREQGTAIVDEHAYRTPRWFHQNVDRYASYSRTGPGVYFGEYAARTNTVRSALAEAAFMIGMERNSDVVKLSSYAPLLARVGGTQWEPDLIYFTADTVLPTASYHVQRMFSTTRGTQIRSIAVDGADSQPVHLPDEGSVRFRSPDAQFQITELTVDGQRAEDVTTIADGTTRTVARIDPRDADVAFTATRTSGARGLAVALGGAGTDSHLEFVLSNWTGLETSVNRYDDGISNGDDGPTPWRSLISGEPVPVRIRLDGARVTVWVDGRIQHDYTQDLRPEQRVVVGAASRPTLTGSDEYVIRIVNATPEPRLARLTDSAGDILTGHGSVLAGASPDAGAPFQPSPVTPTAVEITAAGLPIPAWAVAVAVIKPQPAPTAGSEPVIDAKRVTI